MSLIQEYINTDLRPVCEQSAIEAIRWYFRQSVAYGEFTSWNIVDQKFTDGDILEHLSDASFDIPVAIGTIKHWIANH